MSANNVNSLLRGELAATEAYQQGLASCDDATASELRPIYEEHRAAANRLTQFAESLGIKPARRSGLWGNLARSVEWTATVLGTRATLNALRAGEKLGARWYERALNSDVCPAECTTLIRSTLLPQTRSHIDTLTRVLARQ